MTCARWRGRGEPRAVLDKHGFESFEMLFGAGKLNAVMVN